MNIVCAPSARTHVVLLHLLRMVQMVSDATVIVCAFPINGRNDDDDANVRQCDYIERAEGKLKMNEQLHMHMFPVVFIYIYLCVSVCQNEFLQTGITSMSFHSPVDVTGVASRNGGRNVWTLTVVDALSVGVKYLPRNKWRKLSSIDSNVVGAAMWLHQRMSCAVHEQRKGFTFTVVYLPI